MTTQKLATRCAHVLLGAVALIATLSLHAAAGANTNGFVAEIDTNDRAVVAESYLASIEATTTVHHGWTGSESACNAGTDADTFTAATIESINWFRRMAGLQAVVEDPAASRSAQDAALMMHAQGTLSHYPTTAWRCYSTSGADSAGRSNLTLGVIGPRGIIGQVEDPGAGNEALGHRRWLLFPQLTHVGVGNTSYASAIEVIGDFGPSVSRSDWITWPPSGYVPDDVVFDRWSVSYAGGSVDFSSASASVTENGRPVSVTTYPVQNGFGDPTLGFEVNDINPHASGDVLYDVTITNVIIDGKAQTHRYQFRAFDPHSAPAHQHKCNGYVATIVGTPGDDVITGTTGHDVIVALAGDDRITALGGADIICGGHGDDIIRAGWGNDTIFGGTGADDIQGNGGRDWVDGGLGRDRIAGGAGADTLIGGLHTDRLLGNEGKDVCWGDAAHLVLATSTDNRTCESGG